MWEGDHKNLPFMVLSPRGPASSPWVTMFVDDATRVIVGWAIALTPHAGTVLAALRTGMLPDDTGPASSKAPASCPPAVRSPRRPVDR